MITMPQPVIGISCSVCHQPFTETAWVIHTLQSKPIVASTNAELQQGMDMLGKEVEVEAKSYAGELLGVIRVVPVKVIETPVCYNKSWNGGQKVELNKEFPFVMYDGKPFIHWSKIVLIRTLLDGVIHSTIESYNAELDVHLKEEIQRRYASNT